MTPPGRYASSGSSFARSTGNAAARGVVLIGIAVLIGIVLLAKGFDGSGDAPAASSEPTPTTAPAVSEPGDITETPTSSTEPGEAPSTSAPNTAVSVRPAGEVKVVVANGSGIAGAAGAAKDELTSAGYVAEAKNAVTVPTELSAVYYIDGYVEEAKAVASTLGGTASLLRAAPSDPLALIKSSAGLEEFHIFVILGTDKAIS